MNLSLCSFLNDHSPLTSFKIGVIPYYFIKENSLKVFSKYDVELFLAHANFQACDKRTKPLFSDEV